MTFQEMFDIVVKGLAEQGCQSRIDSRGGPAFCSYRSTKGRKCAAGFLIPDDKYNPKMEEHGSISQSFNQLFNLGFTDEEVVFIRQLQLTHDSALIDDDEKFIKVWCSSGLAARLVEVAKEYELDATIVEQYFPREN